MLIALTVVLLVESFRCMAGCFLKMQGKSVICGISSVLSFGGLSCVGGLFG